MADISGLIDLADAKASLGITTTTNDADIQRYINAATPVIERLTGPILAASNTYTLDGAASGNQSVTGSEGRWSVTLPDRINAVTSVTESGVLITDYVWSVAGVIYAGTTTTPRQFLPGIQNIVVVATVGLPQVPENVALAARELVRHWWQLGRQGNRPQFGNDGSISPQDGFGVPTRRVMELVVPNSAVGGFA